MHAEASTRTFSKPNGSGYITINQTHLEPPEAGMKLPPQFQSLWFPGPSPTTYSQPFDLALPQMLYTKPYWDSIGQRLAPMEQKHVWGRSTQGLSACGLPALSASI
jgi:hypothetical protein